MEEEKRLLNFSMVGFLKLYCVNEVDLSLDRAWGKRPIKTKMLDRDTVIIQLSSVKEVGEILDCAR